MFSRVVYKSRQPAKFTGFAARFRQLLSLLHESKYVEEMDPQPSTFHKTPATLKLKENAGLAILFAAWNQMQYLIVIPMVLNKSPKNSCFPWRYMPLSL